MCLRISLRYDNPDHQAFPHLVVGITIKSHLDVAIINISNYLTGQILGASLESSGWFTCEIRDLSLLPGSYRVDCLLSTQPKGGRTLDQVESATEFEMQSGDFYGTGKLPHIGVFMVPARWIVEN
jgi:hypothetical protein